MATIIDYFGIKYFICMEHILPEDKWINEEVLEAVEEFGPHIPSKVKEDELIIEVDMDDESYVHIEVGGVDIRLKCEHFVAEMIKFIEREVNL